MNATLVSTYNAIVIKVRIRISNYHIPWAHSHTFKLQLCYVIIYNCIESNLFETGNNQSHLNTRKAMITKELQHVAQLEYFTIMYIIPNQN